MHNEIEIKVIKTLSELLADTKTESDIRLDDNLIELGLNSITFIKLVVMLESEFECEFEDENLDYTRYVTLRDIVKYLADKI